LSGPRVRCEVDTCTHWLPGNTCGAANIDILGEGEGRSVRQAELTECRTFCQRGGVSSYLGSTDNVDWTGMVSEPLMSGKQINPSVTCTVDSCAYWREGDLCDADEIDVSGQGVDECQDTNCSTFEERK